MPFAKGINSKVNAMVQLEFELVSYNVTVQHISHYAMVTPNLFVKSFQSLLV